MFLIGNYNITVAATDLIGLKDAELYVRNADNTLSFMGKNDFLNGNVNFVIGDFTGSRTFVVKVTNIVGFSSNYEFTITNNQSLIMPLIVLTVAIGVILLTFIK